MRRKISKLWLLLLFPIVSLALPFVLLAMMMGAKLSLITGPTNIFKAKNQIPPIQDVVGSYRLSDKSRELLAKRGVAISDQSSIRLGEDHALVVTDVPASNGTGHPPGCRYTGEGRWEFHQNGSEVELRFELTSAASATGSRGSCGTYHFAFTELLGRHPPYKIWYALGDPGEDLGLAYVRP